MRSTTLMLASLALLGACTPSEVLEAGARLLAAGRTDDACEVYLEGQRRFPKHPDIASAARGTCPVALAELAGEVATALSRGHRRTALAHLARGRSLLPGDPAVASMEAAIVDSWGAGAVALWDQGNEAAALQEAAGLLSWLPHHPGSRGTADALVSRAVQASVDDAAAGRFEPARARLLRLEASLPGVSVRSTLTHIAGLEGGWLRGQAQTARDRGELGVAWMLARAAASRDGAHQGYLDSTYRAWLGEHALTVSLTATDRGAAAVLGGLQQQLVSPWLRQVSQGPADVSAMIHHDGARCSEQVQHHPAVHQYVAGLQAVPNPAWMAADAEVHSLRRQRVLAERDHQVAWGAVGPAEQAEQAASREAEAARHRLDDVTSLERARTGELDAAQGHLTDAERLLAALRQDVAEAGRHGQRVADARGEVDATSRAVSEGQAAAVAVRPGTSRSEASSRCETASGAGAAAARARGALQEARLAAREARESLETLTTQRDAVLAQLESQYPRRRDAPAAIRLQFDELDRELTQAERALESTLAERERAESALGVADAGAGLAQVCQRWDEAREALDRARQAREAADRRLAQLLREAPHTPTTGEVLAAEHLVASERQDLQGAARRLTEVAQRTELRRREHLQAAATATDTERASRAVRRAADAARSQVAGLDRDIRRAEDSRDAQPPSLMQEQRAQLAYDVETWTRTCSASVRGSLTVAGAGSRSLGETASVSVSDQAWAPVPGVGLRGDPLLFPADSSTLSKRLDGELISALTDALWAELEATVRARSQAPTGSVDEAANGMILGMTAGLWGERELAGFASAELGVGW